jgi:hypothetical protein
MKPIYRWLLLAAAQLVFLLAAVHLALGHHGLASPAGPFGIPRGNLLAWAMIAALPLAAWLALLNSSLSRVALVLAILGTLWLPVSILLAGNVELNFAGGLPLLAWLAYTAVCLLGPVLLALGWLVLRFFRGSGRTSRNMRR